ncbi:MAG: ABC transporter permease, partial [Gemmatimonadota bacterium]
MSRGYRMLLRLLPRAFRVRHGAAMEESFAELHAAARRGGRIAVLRLWLREALDLCRAAGTVRAADAALAAEARRPNSRRHILGSFRDDARLAVRATLRNRAFFVLAAVTLGLGVGATTAMYGAFRAVVLDPLPFAEPERLAVPWLIMGAGALIGLGREDTEALHLLPALFSGVEEFGPGAVTATGAAEPVRMQAVWMTPGLPALLGTPPVLGRTFTSEEVARAGTRVLLLSHALWQSWFDGREDVLGRTIEVDGASRTIIGVMPPRAARPDGAARAVDVWLPLSDEDWRRQPIVRLADGVTLEAASERLDALLEVNAPRDFTGGTLVPVLTPGPLHGHLRMLMAAVVLLLIVACVNVSNLLLQRAAERRME